jgi:hypothetical protein
MAEQQQQVPLTGEQLQQVHNDGALIDFLSSLLDYTPTGFVIISCRLQAMLLFTGKTQFSCVFEMLEIKY